MAEMFMKKMACIWAFASRPVAGFYNTRNTLTQNTLRKDNVIPIFWDAFRVDKFMIKQYYKSIGAFVNTVTQFIHRGSYAHIVTVVRKFS